MARAEERGALQGTRAPGVRGFLIRYLWHIAKVLAHRALLPPACLLLLVVGCLPTDEPPARTEESAQTTPEPRVPGVIDSILAPTPLPPVPWPVEQPPPPPVPRPAVEPTEPAAGEPAPGPGELPPEAPPELPPAATPPPPSMAPAERESIQVVPPSAPAPQESTPVVPPSAPAERESIDVAGPSTPTVVGAPLDSTAAPGPPVGVVKPSAPADSARAITPPDSTARPRSPARPQPAPPSTTPAPRRSMGISQPAAPPLADSIRVRPRLWGFTAEMTPAQDALLYRLAQALWSRRALQEGGLLSERERAREDSIPFRLMPPRRVGKVIPDQSVSQVAGQIGAGTVEQWRTLRETEIAPRIRLRQEDYLARLIRVRYRELMAAEAERVRRAGTTATTRRGLVRIDLPVELPSQLQSIFGEGKPNLSVSGSERITFSGTSRWRVNEQITEINRRQSKFPQLDMKQELNLKLTGTIGDKVSVDVDQSSQASTPLANRIKIRYKGYDDEILQRIDLGNTSLNLPGTKYVSFGGRAEGLFGINSLARLGDMEITSILSKQEGKTDAKSVTRSAEVRTIRIDDYDYVRGKYFFLQDPNGCPWQLDEGAIDVFIDDQVAGNNQQQSAVRATATLRGGTAPEDSTYRGSFRLLQPGDPPTGEYLVQRNAYDGHPIIILHQPLDENHVLAVRYVGQWLDPYTGLPIESFTVGDQAPSDTLRLKMIRPSKTDPRVDPSNLRSGAWAGVHPLELRNIYDLGARNILAQGFELRIRLKRTVGGATNPDRYTDPSLGEVTFLRMTGIDLSEVKSGGEIPGHDDRIDEGWLNYQSGLLRLPDLRPFDPDSADLCLVAPECAGYNVCRFYPNENDRQREPRLRPLPGAPGTTGEEDLASAYLVSSIYDQLNRTDLEQRSKYYLDVTYRSPVSTIPLNASNILPGSEVVTASGRTLARDRDYRIDYDLGEVEILESAGLTESDEIRVTYSYIGFGGGGASKTLAGVSALYKPEGSDFSLSSSWLYESRGGAPGQEGRRPRLGQEPARTLVGELAGTWRAESRRVTGLFDRLPGLDLRQPAKLDLAFGGGLSLPNPNTKNQLYLDDFDGAKDVMSLSMSRRLWRFASIPYSPILPDAPLPSERDSLRAEAKGELWWYSPRNAVREGDLQPTLTERERDDNRQVLRLQFFPRGETPEERKRSWGGVTTVLSARGTDLSRAQFLDIWVNDFRQYNPDPSPDQARRGMLVLDIGTVSEDAMWYRNDPRQPAAWEVKPPNGILDTEDQNGDNRLDQGTDLNEDTGLDGLRQGLVGADPLDVYGYDENASDSDPRKYSLVNGTEGNQELDSEDLNGNGNLERLSSYYQIAIDLAREDLWETDVYRDYVYNNPGASPDLVAANNGWRRIRIPLRNDSLVVPRQETGAAAPSWEQVFHCRLWVTGFEDSTEAMLEVGGIEITGNRWFERPLSSLDDRPLPDSSLVPGEDFFVGVVNNKDDAAIYTSPYEVRKDEGISEREQAISMNFRRLGSGHRGAIYRTYSSRQDYTLYETMEFFLNRYFDSGTADLDCAVRLSRDPGSDTTNYYEYRTPVGAEWNLVKIDFAELSRLQLETPDSTTGVVERDLGGGVVIRRKGSPSLTSIQRVTFLVSNRGASELTRGSVWINELRLTGVKKDPGIAARLAATADLGKVGRFSFNWERLGADFLRIGQDRGSGITSTNWNLSGQSDLLGYAERLGLASSVRGSFSNRRDVPKFRTNSDLVLDTARDRDITMLRTDEVNFSLQKQRRASGWTRWVIEPFSIGGGYSRRINDTPNLRDRTAARTGNVGWSLPLDQWGEITLRRLRGTKLRLLPTNFSVNASGSRTRTTRESRTDLNQAYKPDPTVDLKQAGLTLSSGARPLQPISYQWSSVRDLMRKENETSILGVGIGRETGRTHAVTGTWQVPLLRSALAPSTNWQSGSNLTLSRQATGTAIAGEPDRENSFRNNRSLGFSGRLGLAEMIRTLTSLGTRGGDSARASAPRGAEGLLSGRLRLNTVNGSLTLTRSSDFTRRVGEPGLLYQLGFSEDPGRARPLSRADARYGEGRALNLDTNVGLPSSASLTLRFSRQDTRNRGSGLATRSVTSKWPDASVNWGSLHRQLRIDRFFRSFTATSGYSRESSEQGTAASPRDQTTTRSNFRPLLNINATLRSGMSLTFTSSASSTTDERFRPTLSVNERVDQQFTLGAKKTYTLTRQVEVPLTGRTQTVQTRLDLNVDFDYRTNRSETRTLGQRPVTNEDRMKWSATTGVGYQFTQNINGNGSIGFGQDTDRKNEANTSRFITISLGASFTF